ncbi:signal peptidase I [Enterococcus plantarum]|uniref:Signal peptidase I n=1 Tax=Enterococcus haemoperoxidus ATCC BAA-382 TaxID=1158608 RepID=R2STY8_9ENTE|nr:MULTISPECIES: signal peptidase I [Enterococcus]EOH98710.1 signal peptidase I [Enterococcus haemoperoxidus ATCC BAA-382]EOT62107.1 signal peptidase I [Enterococcus haemoperoxidus ATCC BAA-382]OEG12618.1 signal peptidase I [Enterococcus plantarum]OJG55812.1 signal peptidase I [Enterococcus haemoperoxidus]
MEKQKKVLKKARSLKKNDTAEHIEVEQKMRKKRVKKNSTAKKSKQKAKQNRGQMSDSVIKRNRKKKINREKIKKKRRKRILARGWNLVFYTFILIMLFGAVMFSFNDSESKSFFGYRFMTVKTNSMAQKKDRPKHNDGFEAGAMIFLKSIPPEELKVGDIITYKPFEGEQEIYLTHRLIKIDKELNQETGLFFTTQGDANDNPDSPIHSNQYVGKVVFHIEYIGRIIQFIRDNLIIVLVLLCAIFAFSLTIKYYLSLPSAKSKSV